MFYLDGAVVLWASKKQHFIALSRMEVEYVIASTMTCQAFWMTRVLQDLKQKQLKPTRVHYENKFAIIKLFSPPRTKHIEIRYHFIKELINKGEIDLHHCSIEE